MFRNWIQNVSMYNSKSTIYWHFQYRYLFLFFWKMACHRNKLLLMRRVFIQINLEHGLFSHSNKNRLNLFRLFILQLDFCCMKSSKHNCIRARKFETTVQSSKCLKSHLYRFKRSINSIIIWYPLKLNYSTQTFAHSKNKKMRAFE